MVFVLCYLPLPRIVSVHRACICKGVPGHRQAQPIYPASCWPLQTGIVLLNAELIGMLLVSMCVVVQHTFCVLQSLPLNPPVDEKPELLRFVKKKAVLKVLSQTCLSIGYHNFVHIYTVFTTGCGAPCETTCCTVTSISMHECKAQPNTSFAY